MAPTFTRLQSFKFLRVGTLETFLYSDPIENGDTSSTHLKGHPATGRGGPRGSG